MADMTGIDALLSVATPDAFASIDDVTRENFGRFIDYYQASGYSTEGVAKVVDEQLGTTDLADVLPSGQEAEPTESAMSIDETYQVLGDAAGQDLAEAFGEAMPHMEIMQGLWEELHPLLCQGGQAEARALAGQGRRPGDGVTTRCTRRLRPSSNRTTRRASRAYWTTRRE